jgi:hypothetical protein
LLEGETFAAAAPPAHGLPVRPLWPVAVPLAEGEVVPGAGAGLDPAPSVPLVPPLIPPLVPPLMPALPALPPPALPPAPPPPDCANAIPALAANSAAVSAARVFVRSIM